MQLIQFSIFFQTIQLLTLHCMHHHTLLKSTVPYTYHPSYTPHIYSLSSLLFSHYLFCMLVHYYSFWFTPFTYYKTFLLALPSSFISYILFLWPFLTFLFFILGITHPLEFLFNPCQLAQSFKCFIHNFWYTTWTEFLIEQQYTLFGNILYEFRGAIEYKIFCFIFVSSLNV